MGRRALQRSPKPIQSGPVTPTPIENESASDNNSSSTDYVSKAPLQPPSSPGSRGLDRVLLERNLERLILERGNQNQSPDLEKLLHARDRSREPLHLADLSLDDWQMKVDESQSKSKEDNNVMVDRPTDSNEDTRQHSTSMPELGISGSSDVTPGDSTTSGSPCKKGKGALSVRFQGDNEAFEPDEADSRSHGRNLPKSRSYSGKSRHGNSQEKRRAKESTSDSHATRSSRHVDDDAASYCSTCSSSSSSDDLDYQLPPRRAYGGVRISYVPNDALACARWRQQGNQRSPTKKITIDDKDKNCIIS